MSVSEWEGDGCPWPSQTQGVELNSAQTACVTAHHWRNRLISSTSP